ncbi:PEP-CTERM/exosortase system-associated acyltransferase [Micavibrio aeruginosavorus]|nr:PEP-CTERM/exosortase system-associated acyltransferase [Micavibrio aeruginosavorus]
MSTQDFLATCLDSVRSKSFYPAYQKAFRIIQADTNALKEIVFRLRYEIYCVDNDMEQTSGASTSAMEKDAFDDNSLHYLLYHKMTDEPVGTVRVVMPRTDRPLSSFPLQFVCDHPLLHMPDRVHRFCEVSRLCMTRDFRRRPGDGRVLPSYNEQDQAVRMNADGTTVFIRRVIPFAPLGLLRAAFEGALDNGLTDCVCVMDPDQLYALQRIGLSYRVLGPRLDIGGQQQPIIFNIKHALDNMILQNPPCWEIVSDRGRLHIKANELDQNQWQDQIFDQQCMDMIFERLTTPPPRV